jgi:hypothetical protein
MNYYVPIKDYFVHMPTTGTCILTEKVGGRTTKREVYRGSIQTLMKALHRCKEKGITIKHMS